MIALLEPGGWLLGAVARELTLFAGFALLLGGLDDLLVDLIWGARLLWRRLTVYRRHARATARTLPPPAVPGRIVVFVPAWQESAVIGRMLRAALDRFEHDDFRIYAGTYPNDPATAAAVEAVGDYRIRHVSGMVPGPTTKAECLNRLWRAMLAEEVLDGKPVKAIVLHDAEDVVHPLELRVFDRLIERFDLVQLPVLPLLGAGSAWISGHYADEFAEAHGRQLAVREALGAGIPAAGVGCALSRAAMERMAEAGGGQPFDESSLTEDYEIGLRLRAFGRRAAFVAMPAAPGAGLVAVRAFFPGDLNAAVRQKTRWMIGIALAGWDRLRWSGGLAERWMRLRDRRSVLAALVLAVAYAALVLTILCTVLGVHVRWPAWSGPLLAANGLLLAWRLGVRGLTVTYHYGWREGLRAVPRVFVANIIAMMAARRAILSYRPGAVPQWDKTTHHFPETLPCD